MTSGKRRVIGAGIARIGAGWRILALAVRAQQVEGGGASTEITLRGPV